METNFFKILHFLVSVGACNLILRIHAVVNWQLPKPNIRWPVSLDITSLLFDLNYKFINGSFAFSPGKIYILIFIRTVLSFNEKKMAISLNCTDWANTGKIARIQIKSTFQGKIKIRAFKSSSVRYHIDHGKNRSYLFSFWLSTIFVKGPKWPYSSAFFHLKEHGEQHLHCVFIILLNCYSRVPILIENQFLFFDKVMKFHRHLQPPLPSIQME